MRIVIVNIPVCIFFIILIDLKMRGKSETKILLYIKSQVELNKKVKEKFQQIKCDVKADFINSFFSLYAKIALNYIEIA